MSILGEKLQSRRQMYSGFSRLLILLSISSVLVGGLSQIGCGGSPQQTQKNLVEEVKLWLGAPYAYGGQDRITGADCSGFVRQVYRKVHGLELRGYTELQLDQLRRTGSRLRRPRDITTWRFGDLIFIKANQSNTERRVDHVAIYLGDGYMVDSAAGRGVSIRAVPPRWGRLLVDVFRPIEQFEHVSMSSHEVDRAFGTAFGRSDTRFEEMLLEVSTWLGTPYRKGGAEKSTGVDDGVFVASLYTQVLKRSIGRSTAEQISYLAKRERELIDPLAVEIWRFGDLIYLRLEVGVRAGGEAHVAMYLGDGMIVDVTREDGVSVRELPPEWMSGDLRVFRPTDVFEHKSPFQDELERLLRRELL